MRSKVAETLVHLPVGALRHAFLSTIVAGLLIAGPASAQGTSQWTGEAIIPDFTGQVERLTLGLALDLAISSEPSSAPSPLPGAARDVSGTATITFTAPNQPRSYTMSGEAKGTLAASADVKTWAVHLEWDIDVRTADAETAQTFATLPGPGWNEAAMVRIVFDGEAIEPDDDAPTRMTGTGNINLADFGCIIVTAMSEKDPDMAALPARCGRIDLAAQWTTTAASSCAVAAPPEESARLFQSMMPAIGHPRCQNCHGAFNVFSADTPTHPGGDMRQFGEVDPVFGGEPEEVPFEQGPVCDDCHDLGKGEWRQSRVANIQWAGGSERQICAAWLASTGSASADDLWAHLANDLRIKLGFEGLRGVSELVLFDVESEGPLPPPMTHDQFLELARAWIDGAGIGGPGARKCACAGLQ